MPHGPQYAISTGINATSFNRAALQPTLDLGELLNNTKIYGLAARMGDGSLLEDQNGHYDRSQVATIEAHVEKYLAREGKDFIEYLKKRGKEPKLDGIGSAPLGDRTVAAIAKSGYITLLLGNRDFDVRVREMGRAYGLNDNEALEYVLTHEMGHAAGVEQEVANERLLHEYFKTKVGEYHTKLKEAEKKDDKQSMSAAAEPLARYQKLAKVAEYRTKLGEAVLKGRKQTYDGKT